jgi:hypothetical protein
MHHYIYVTQLLYKYETLILLRGLPLIKEEGWWSRHSGRSSLVTSPPYGLVLLAPRVLGLLLLVPSLL